MGWFSRIESPELTRLSIAIWQCFCDDLRLQDAKNPRFKSLQECFTRQLKPGLRPQDSRLDIVSSPCDAIVGACGRIRDNRLFQAKGFPYTLEELIPDARLAARYRNGQFVTLRLKSSMYHRFHAPVDCKIRRVSYVSGDTWNVNPIALKKVEKLFCKNERAVLELEFGQSDYSLTLVPVAAILVASMKFHFLAEPLDLKYRGANLIPCNATLRKGQEMGYNLNRKVVLLSIWALTPVALLLSPDLLGPLSPATDLVGFISNTARVWLFVGLGAVVFRTVHLFKLMGVQSGLVWMTKIFTDPFHDIKIYQKSPYYILKGEMYDTMENWYDDAPLDPRT